MIDDTQFDPDAPVHEAPDSEKPPVTLPAGTYGHGGEAEIVHCKMDLKDSNEGPVKYLSVLVAVQHPTLGRVAVGTSPFGKANTSTKPNSASLYNTFIRNLGLAGLTSNQMNDQKKGMKVIVTVTNREGKRDENGNVPVYADISGIWDRDKAQAAGQQAGQ
jgi:hypothetical protein